MFPFWLDLSCDALETVALSAVAVLVWLFQMLAPRGSC